MTYLLNVLLFLAAVVALLSGKYEVPYPCTPSTPHEVGWIAVLFGIPLVTDFVCIFIGKNRR